MVQRMLMYHILLLPRYTPSRIIIDADYVTYLSK